MRDAEQDRRHGVALIVLFALSLPAVTPYLRGDGIGYYAYLASAVIDRDLDFEDEYRHADPSSCRLYFEEDGGPNPARLTEAGRFGNQYSVGPALLWAPGFLLAHAGSHAWNRLASDGRVETDGFSWPYLAVCAAATAVLGFLGLWLSRSLARALGLGPWASFWGVLGMWLASGLPVYMYFLPFMSHAHSLFAVALTAWYWHRTYAPPTAAAPEIRSPAQWGVLGLLCGAAFTTYYLNGLLGLFVVFDGLAMLGARRAAGALLPGLGRLATRAVLPATAGVLLGVVPHAVVKYLIYGSPFELGYRHRLGLLSPQFLREIFSTEQGLFTWTPIALLAVLGLAPLLRRHRALGIRLAAVLLLHWWVIASYPSGHGVSSFSNRYFLQLLPFFVLGLASLYEWALGRWPGHARALRWGVPALTGLLILWNAGFIFQWGANIVPNRGAVSFSAVARNQFTAVPAKLTSMLGPFLVARSSLIEEIEREDLEEQEHIPLRPGICDR